MNFKNILKKTKPQAVTVAKQQGREGGCVEVEQMQVGWEEHILSVFSLKAIRQAKKKMV